MTNKIEISRQLADIRKLAELACGTSHDSPEYRRFIAAINPTLLLDLTAAPVVERQEPVAYRWRHPANPIYADRKVWDPITLELGRVYLERKERAITNNQRYQEDEYYFAIEVEPLYISPPAPVSVALPDPLPRNPGYWHDLDLLDKIDDAEAKGFNRAIDKVKELNQ